MRMMMKVVMETEKANEAIRSGKLMTTIPKILADVKPEAAYFMADEHGRRTGIIIFDMTSTSQIPKLAEPWFLAFHAQVTFQPVMNPQDLAAATPDIEHVVKNY
jgi:hypothetical protein